MAIFYSHFVFYEIFCNVRQRFIREGFTKTIHGNNHLSNKREEAE